MTCRGGGLDRGFWAPTTALRPRRTTGAGSGLAGRPAAAHQGADTSRLPARALRRGLSGAPEAAGGRGFPLPSSSTAAEPPAFSAHRRARAAPTSRPEPGSRGPGRPPFPSPPGWPSPGRALPARLHPGRSDRLGSPSWPARLSHGAGPTLQRPLRIPAGADRPPSLARSLR